MTVSRCARTTLLAAFAFSSATAFATATDELRDFVRTVKSGKSTFTQTVTAPNGRQKVSNGSFEFARPNRFRFVYEKPYAQTVVGDGTKVWIYDPDLNQASSRKTGDALANTPAALIVSNDIDKVFTLADQPSKDGIDWVLATPRQAEGTVRALRIGFRAHALAQLQIDDSFGQKSMIVFNGFEPNAKLAADTFVFVPPKGADVSEQ
ncbi:MAG: outer membrane lipoprotein chaperone LolA [Burkholderiales bacterium]|nr:outer membrane lipoprotein chaperone LolA [Burkholderiales bacterium]